MSIYKNIQKLCKDRGISVMALEESIGFTKGYLYKWEMHVPSIEKVKTVADFFEVSVDSLIRESD